MPPPRATFIEAVRSRANRYNLPADTMVRQIDAESGFDPSAISPKGARGIAQVMPDTWQAAIANRWVAPDADITNVDANLEVHARVMSENMDRYNNDITKSLAAYNAGPNWVDYALGIRSLAPKTDENGNNVTRSDGTVVMVPKPFTAAYRTQEAREQRRETGTMTRSMLPDETQRYLTRILQRR